MKDLVLHDVKRYLYPDGIRNQVKAYTTTFDGHTFVIIGNEEQTLYHLYGEDIKHILQIDASQEMITPISNLLYEPKILMVTGAEVIFYDYNTTDTIKFDFNTNILAANAFVLNSCIAVVSTTDVILYSIHADVGQLDPIGSSPHSDKPEESVYVGWGSTDTQFQGPTSKRVVPVACNYDSDDKKPQISWRADGDMFAVNMHDNRNRVVKIFDDNCKLLYVTDFRGLESLVDFRPIANMLTTIRSTNGFNQIVTFIETNGQIFSSFDLEDAKKVMDAKWSLCGTALAVVRLYDEEDKPDKVCLDVYLESNSEWACKQRLQFDMEKWCGFEWVYSLKNIFKLKIFTNDGIFDYQFAGKIVKCNHPYGSYGVSATTFGSRVEFQYLIDDDCEDYEKFVSTYSIKMDNQISYLAFDAYNYVVAIIDYKYNGKLYNYKKGVSWDLLGEFTMHNFNDLMPLCYRTIQIDDTYDIYAITYSSDPKNLDVLYRYRLENNCLSNIINQHINDGVFSLNYPINDKCKGNLVLFEHKDYALPIIDAFAYRTTKDIVKITLNSTGQLSLNGVHAKAFVTSMFYDAENFIITVSKEIGEGDSGDYIISIKLSDSNIKRLMDGVDPFNFAYNRSIEHGGVCINLIHNSATMLLLMPRGNTEVVEIRSITIETLSGLIDNLKYKLAYKLINYYGMGLNMLVDIHPLQFLGNVRHVYAELKEFDVFPKIVMDLRESSHQYKEGVYVFDFPDISNKMEQVCEALITCCCEEMLINMNARAVTLLSLFSTYPNFNIPKAIEFLSTYAHSTDLSYAEVPIHAMSAYVSYEDMFATALSIYDLDLAELIVTISQMDPSHYTTFINSLRKKERNAQRFMICKFLHDYKLATVYLCEIYENTEEEFADNAKNDLITYVKENGTTKIAYQTLHENDKCMEDLAPLYASELDSNKHYLESGMVFFRHRHFVEAFDEFVKGPHYDEALASIKAMDVEEGEKSVKLNHLADVMFKTGEYAQAARTYLVELEDIDRAVVCFLEARQYMTVYNMALKLPEGKSIISGSIIPSMLEYCEKMSQKLTDDKTAFESYYDRLLQIQTGRINDACDKKFNALCDQKESTNEDLYFDTESVSSVRTTSSTRSYGSSASSRQRRKEALRLTSLRVGGAYEDIALIVKLHDMAAEVFSMQQEIKKLFAAFYCIMPGQRDHYLKQINLHLLDYENFIISVAGSIWRKDFTDITAVEAAIAICPNLHLLDPRYRFAPLNMKIVWESGMAAETVNDEYF